MSHYQRAKMWWTWHLISITTQKTACSSQDSLFCIQWKFMTPDQLASPLKFRWSFAHKRFFFVFDHKSIHLFQNKQCFQAIEFMDQPIPEKPDIFWIHTCCASDCHIYHQFPQSPLGMPGTMIPLLVGTQEKGKGNTESRCLSKLD